MSDTILHLVPAGYFRSLPASEDYLPREFPQDGFIHCTRKPDMMLRVANQFYKDVAGELLMLVIAESRVIAQIKYESPEPGGHLFPHIYGSLNRDAIVEMRTARRAVDGTFVSV